MGGFVSESGSARPSVVPSFLILAASNVLGFN
jgi:hypothetical protein